MRCSKLLSVFVGAIFPLALFAGGATEQKLQTRDQAPPAWVIQHPGDSDGKSYFVAVGASDTNQEDQANDAAAMDLVNQINRYLGVTINSNSIATEIATANEYQAKIIGTVKQTATGDIAGMRLADRYVQHSAKKVTVYLLGEYATSDLAAEKAKRAALVKEAEDAVVVPETKAAAAEKAGQIIDALRWYLEAASAAANGKVRNSDVKFERTMQSALRVITRLQIAKVSGPASTMARQPFDQDFVVALSDAQSGKAVGLADLAVGFREYQNTGKFRMKSQAVVTDLQGLAKFRLPNPIAVGAEKISFALDISAYLRTLDGLSGKQKDLVDSLLDAAGGKKVSFDFTVQSTAKNASIGDLVLELDDKGNQIADQKTEQGIQQKLSAAGFKLVQLAVSANFLVGKTDQEIHLLLKDVAARKAERIAYGTAKIVSFDDRGTDGFIVKASADITVIDIKTGETLLAFNQTSNAQGNDKASAISAALSKLGQDIGDKLARDLP